MNRRWRSARTALLILAVAIAALAFLAALANAFNWDGWWVIAVVVTLAALTLVWKVWSDVIKPAREQRVTEQTEQRHATALQFQLSRDDYGVAVWLSNRGTHEVRRIEVVGMTLGGDRDPGLAGPPYHADDAAGLKHSYTPGNDLMVEIDYIDPNRGVWLATYPETHIEDRPTEIRFEAWWSDHEGRRRYAMGVGDLANPRGSVEMVPRNLS